MPYEKAQAKKQFRVCLDEFKRSHPTYIDAVLLDRIATDDRAAGVWDLVARFSEKSKGLFFISVVWALQLSRGARQAPFVYSTLLKGLDDDILAMDRIISIIERTRPETALILREERDTRDLHRSVIASKQAWDPRLSRKSKTKTSGRTVFMKLLGGATGDHFGQRHYEAVAAVTNILFETTDGTGDVSAEDVKKACRRAEAKQATPRRSGKIRTQK